MLPQNLKYSGKVEAAPAQSYRTNIQPISGSSGYKKGNNIIFNIPTSNNLVLAPTESYLKFKMTLTNSATANAYRWDSCGAHGLIQRIKVFHGSNLLSDIDGYGLLAKTLFTLQNPEDANKGKYNIMAGTRNDVSSTAGTTLTSGDGGLMAISAVVEKYYCLNLVSLIGTLCPSQYLPLFAMTSAPLRVEITLVSDNILAMNDFLGTATFQLDEVEYIAQFIKLSDVAMEMIYGSLGGQPLQIAVPDWANFQSTGNLTTAVTQQNFPIPAKYSSLKSIIATIRQNPNGLKACFPYSSTTQSVSSYYFRVGSQILPSKAPDSTVEMFAEALKAMGSMSDTLYTPSVNLASYTLATDTAAAAVADVATTNSGNFFIGIDLENYVNSPKNTIFAGYNSNTDDIYLVLNHKAAAGAVSVRYDAFALFDSVLVFENNTCYRKF